MRCLKLPMKLLTGMVGMANEEEINGLIRALIAWQENRFPEYELVVLSLPKYDQAEREKMLDRFTELMRRMEYATGT